MWRAMMMEDDCAYSKHDWWHWGWLNRMSWATHSDFTADMSCAWAKVWEGERCRRQRCDSHHVKAPAKCIHFFLYLFIRTSEYVFQGMWNINSWMMWLKDAFMIGIWGGNFTLVPLNETCVAFRSHLTNLINNRSSPMVTLPHGNSVGDAKIQSSVGPIFWQLIVGSTSHTDADWLPKKRWLMRWLCRSSSVFYSLLIPTSHTFTLPLLFKHLENCVWWSLLSGLIFIFILVFSCLP